MVNDALIPAIATLDHLKITFEPEGRGATDVHQMLHASFILEQRVRVRPIFRMDGVLSLEGGLWW